jgi:hypothetical protein
MYLVFAIETDAGEKYRAFQGTLGVHLLIAPAGIFYVLESHKKKPYMFLVWIFFGIFVFDFYAVLETFIHLKRTIFDFWQVIAASSTWPFILSTSTLAWYIYILCTEPKIKFRA